jgi:hypothetical protein
MKKERNQEMHDTSKMLSDILLNVLSSKEEPTAVEESATVEAPAVLEPGVEAPPLEEQIEAPDFEEQRPNEEPRANPTRKAKPYSGPGSKFYFKTDNLKFDSANAEGAFWRDVD